jgi:hypothetical protein
VNDKCKIMKLITCDSRQSADRLFKLLTTTNSQKLTDGIIECLIKTYDEEFHFNTVIKNLSSNNRTRKVSLQVLSAHSTEKATKPLLLLYNSGIIKTKVELKQLINILSITDSEESIEFLWSMLSQNDEELCELSFLKLIPLTFAKELLEKIPDKLILTGESCRVLVKHFIDKHKLNTRDIGMEIKDGKTLFIQGKNENYEFDMVIKFRELELMDRNDYDRTRTLFRYYKPILKKLEEEEKISPINFGELKKLIRDWMEDGLYEGAEVFTGFDIMSDNKEFTIRNLLEIITQRNLMEVNSHEEIGKLLIREQCIDLNLELVISCMIGLDTNKGFFGYLNLLVPQITLENADQIFHGFQADSTSFGLLLKRHDDSGSKCNFRKELLEDEIFISIVKEHRINYLARLYQ